jgi:hypothetical protein
MRLCGKSLPFSLIMLGLLACFCIATKDGKRRWKSPKLARICGGSLAKKPRIVKSNGNRPSSTPLQGQVIAPDGKPRQKDEADVRLDRSYARSEAYPLTSFMHSYKDACEGKTIDVEVKRNLMLPPYSSKRNKVTAIAVTSAFVDKAQKEWNEEQSEDNHCALQRARHVRADAAIRPVVPGFVP